MSDKRMFFKPNNIIFYHLKAFLSCARYFSANKIFSIFSNKMGGSSINISKKPGRLMSFDEIQIATRDRLYITVSILTVLLCLLFQYDEHNLLSRLMVAR